MTLRVLLVCAVSTPEQAKDEKESLPAQERDLLAVAEREGWDVVDIIRIPGFSRRYFTLRELVDAANEASEPGPSQLEQHIDAADFDVMAVRSTNRFGREQSINAEIIGKVIRVAGAKIYSQMDGMIDAANFRAMAAITGYRDAGQVDEFVRGRAMGILGNAKKGLPPTGRVPISHRIVRSAQTGKPERIELREEQLPMLRDLATLVLAGVSYNRLESEMFQRFGHGKNGAYYAAKTFVRLLLNPIVWGHTVIRWQRTKQQSFPAGTWALDATEPPPVGVELFYNTVPAAYTGALAEALKAELRRRTEVFNRYGQAQTVSRFTGLVYCDACGWRLSYVRRVLGGIEYVYLRCNQAQNERHYHAARRCENRKLLKEADVYEWLNRYIGECLEKNSIVFDVQPPPDASAADAAALRTTLAKLERRRDTLLDELGDADDATRAAIRKRVQAATVEIERAKQQAFALDLQAAKAQRQTRDQMAALDYVRAAGLPAFWQLPPLEVNQWLRRLLGSNRLYANEGEVAGWFNLEDLA